MRNNKYEFKLEWTNQEEFRNHIKVLRKQYGDKIPAETALDFPFEFNHGLCRVCKEE